MSSPTLRACGFVGLWCLIGATPSGAAEPIPWRTDYPAARKEAEAKKLPLLVVIGSQDCVYCRKLENHTFADPDIVAFVNAKFIPLKIDATKDPEFAKAMKVTIYRPRLSRGTTGKSTGTSRGICPPINSPRTARKRC